MPPPRPPTSNFTAAATIASGPSGAGVRAMPLPPGQRSSLKLHLSGSYSV